MSTQTPIQVLLSLDLLDAVVARRLQVSCRTVGRWRSGRSVPMAQHQTTALAYLTEVNTKIFSLLANTALSRSAA